MSAPQVQLPGPLEQALRQHCEEAYPLEACGAILGLLDETGPLWRILGTVPAPNTHGDDQRRRYLVPPEFQVEMERLAQAKGVDVIGYYHSHPDHPAQPSEYDRAHAWDGYLYLICAVEGGQSRALNGFTLDGPGGQFLPVPGDSIGTSPSQE